jgi:hypothetical protein
MISFIWPQRKCLALAIITLILTLANDESTGGGRSSRGAGGIVAAARVSAPSSRDQQDRGGGGGGSGDPEPPSTGLTSYFNSARQLLSTSLDAHNQARAYSGLMPNEDPRTAQMLRETIDKTSNLIQSYQHEGLSTMPPLPNVPGLNTVMRIPDKLLRAELSMLQDGIRMAQEMRERPLLATVNAPRGKHNV